MVTSMNFMPLGALLEGWGIGFLLLPIFILLGAVAGAVGGGIAFARAKERLRQRLVLGALAGALTGCWVALLGADTITTRTQWPRLYTLSFFWCMVGGYAGADEISILLKAIGRGK